MRPTRHAMPSLAGVVAALAIISIGYPNGAEPQVTDPVTLGRQALDANRVDDAIALFEKAVAADPQNPAALAWLGSAQVRKAKTAPLLDRLGWVKKGFTTLDRAVEIFPDNYIVYMVRGITANQVPDSFKKAPVAVKDLSAVIAMREKNPQAVPDPALPSVYLHLGIAHKKNGQAAEARAVWEKGKNAYPSAPEARAMEKELRNLK